MIRVIGFQRVLFILVLGFLVVSAFLYTMYLLKPSLLKSERELAQSRSEISQMSSDMEQLNLGIAKFETQKAKFDKVTQYGFFDPQDRSETRQRLNAMQKESGVLSARFSIAPAVTEVNEKAKEAGYKILNTKIDFSLDAIDDNDIYNFIYLLNYGFPGTVTIENISISRDKEITQPVLRAIGVGEAEAIVKASISTKWLTMVPDTSIEVNSEAAEGEVY
jgi:hypothetical protein